MTTYHVGQAFALTFSSIQTEATNSRISKIVSCKDYDGNGKRNSIFQIGKSSIQKDLRLLGEILSKIQNKHLPCIDQGQKSESIQWIYLRSVFAGDAAPAQRTGVAEGEPWSYTTGMVDMATGKLFTTLTWLKAFPADCAGVHYSNRRHGGYHGGCFWDLTRIIHCCYSQVEIKAQIDMTVHHEAWFWGFGCHTNTEIEREIYRGSLIYKRVGVWHCDQLSGFL